MGDNQKSELRMLLAEAERTIVSLGEEAESYKGIINDLVATKNAQLVQLDEMKERTERLEKLVHASDEKMSEAAIIMSTLIASMEKMHAEAKEALEAAEQGVSRVELKDKVVSITKASDCSDGSAMYDEYKKELTIIREETKPGGVDSSDHFNRKPLK